MTQLSITTSDANCRYLAAPECRTFGTQFGRHIDALGIMLPSNMGLRTLVHRGWIRPRLRVPIPIRALQSWTTFPNHPIQGNEACPTEDRWGLEAWCAATSLFPDDDRPVPKLWMHWLDDSEDSTAACARQHALDPAYGDPEPAAFVHPSCREPVLPWIDFFADWQAYHLAELIRLAEFNVHGVTDQFASCATHAQRHTASFDASAKSLAKRWESRGAFFDYVAAYRTILANCCTRTTFAHDLRLGVRSWASQRGITAEAIRTGICEVLLRQWQQWEDSPPVRGTRLMHRVQQDIQYATRLLWDLTGHPVDPFDQVWFWPSHGPCDWAQLIDALPYEEWLARRDFASNAVHYQRGFPRPFLLGEDQFSALLTRFWPACPPLRRFCLAWVRLHGEMRGRDHDLPADVTIAANERIEQFNLIALHTERLLRYVNDALAPATTKQEPSQRVLLAAARRSLAHLTPPVAVSDQHIDALLKKQTALHAMPDLQQVLCSAASVGSGAAAADELIAAHVNALLARNYAAHHDYLDGELIYPSHDETMPHAGATLLSSCLLVVIAAMHSLAPTCEG